MSEEDQTEKAEYDKGMQDGLLMFSKYTSVQRIREWLSIEMTAPSARIRGMEAAARLIIAARESNGE